MHVKWRDYDDVTAEPVSSIVRDTRGDPDILRQIQDAQQRYRAEHPVRVPADGHDLPALDPPGGQVPVPDSTAGSRPAPTRTLPTRRARPTQFHLEHVVCPAYRDIARVHALRTRARAYLDQGARCSGRRGRCRGAVGPDPPAEPLEARQRPMGLSGPDPPIRPYPCVSCVYVVCMFCVCPLHGLPVYTCQSGRV